MESVDVSRIRKDLVVHAKLRGESGKKVADIPGMVVGVVDHMEGNRWIKLSRGQSDDEQPHWIPLDWVESVDNEAVYLSKTADEYSRGKRDQNPEMML